MKSLSRKLSIPIILLAAAVLALPPATANAANKSSDSNDVLVKKGTVIKAINIANSSIEVETVKNRETHIYKIDSLTVITIRGVPAKFSDLQFGMQILNLTERDNETLDAIDTDSAAKIKHVK